MKPSGQALGWRSLLRSGLVLIILAGPEAWAQPGALRWFYDAGQTIYSSPALSSDGTVYLGTAAGVCAITNSGSLVSNKWTFATVGQQRSCPAIGADGTIYSAAGNLYALAPDGSQKWSFGAGAGIGAPTVALDGTVYFMGIYGNLFAVSPTGTQQWATPIGSDTPQTSPSLLSDGTLCANSPGVGLLYALNPDGTIKWQAAIPGAADSPAISSDGTLYVSAGYSVVALDSKGTIQWNFTTNGAIGASPVLGKDGTIYVTGWKSYYPLGYLVVLRAISTGGSLKWEFKPAPWGQVYTPSSPAVDSSGIIYFAGFNTLYAVSPAGEQLWSFFSGGSATDPSGYSYTSPAIGRDGTIYATFGSRLYAISGTNGPADSAWPMYRQNARRTGKCEKPSLQKLQKRTDSNFEFQLYPQQLGLTYTVESSTNLQTWVSLTSFVANTFPEGVADLTATNSEHRFYRAFSAP